MRKTKASVIIVDAYGVFNFGQGISPNAISTFKQWLEEGKKVFILSNTTALNEGAIKSYAKKGVIKGVHYTDMMTSGQYASEDIQAGNLPVNGKNYYVFGTANFKSTNPVPAIFEGSEYKVVANIADADFIYCGIPQLKKENGEVYDTTEAEDFRAMVKKLVETGLPMVCANPDKTANEGGRFVVRQGTIAEMYEQFGGKVILYGKPDRRIFDSLINRYGLQAANRQDMLMIGDTIRTDIKGAKAAAIPSVLVLEGGVSEMEMQRKEMTLAEYIEAESVVPDEVWGRVCEEPLF